MPHWFHESPVRRAAVQYGKNATFRALAPLASKCSTVSRRGGIVFFGHRVLRGVADPVSRHFSRIAGQALTEETFLRRLNWLRSGWEFVTLDQAVSGSATGRPWAVLTFDDAYRDFLEVIAPHLTALGVPCTFYITVDCLDRKELLWFDQIYCSLAVPESDVIQLRGFGSTIFHLATAAGRAKAAVTLCQIVSRMSDAQRQDIVAQIVEQTGRGCVAPKDLYLSRADVAKLSETPGVTIASHTVSHPNLLTLSDEAAANELAQSKAELEAITGRRIRHISYPNGLYDERISLLARECGYETAASTSGGKPGNSMGVPRVNLGWWNDSEFRVRTSPRFRHHALFGLSALWAEQGLGVARGALSGESRQ